MAKRWINSADVLVDDQGRIGIVFPSELVTSNRLKVDAVVTAELDAEAITGSPPYTLADLYDRLEYGLFDYGYPFFQELRGDLDYYLYNSNYGGEPWLATVDRSINDGFYYSLYNQWGYQPWLETLNNAVNDGFYYHLYDQNSYQPWLQTIHYDFESYLYDWGNYRPWLETLRDEVSALRAVLEDVYDAAQHALRTV
jgi:hypothetical protein